MSEETGLIEISKLNALEVFQEPEGLQPIIDRIRERAMSVVPNLETASGRKEVASMAHRVARSKVALDGLGKELVAGWKEKSAKVDAERRRMRDELDALKEEVRQPLTEWEEAENKRVNTLRVRLESMNLLLDGLDGNGEETSEQIAARLGRLRAIKIDDSWQEFKAQAAEDKLRINQELSAEIIKRKEREEEREELERRRTEEEARIRAEEEERLRKEGEERARREAEEERQRMVAEQEAERHRITAEKEDAERRAKEAAERAKQDAAEAARRERERIEAEQRARAEEDRKRAEDKQHREAVIRNAVSGLVNAGLKKADASKAIAAIESGHVPSVTINY